MNADYPLSSAQIKLVGKLIPPGAFLDVHLERGVYLSQETVQEMGNSIFLKVFSLTCQGGKAFY